MFWKKAPKLPRKRYRILGRLQAYVSNKLNEKSIKFYVLSIFLDIPGQEPYVIRRYVNEIFKVETEMKKKNVWRGLVNSTGQALPIFGYAVALYYGGLLVADGEMHFKDIIK